jgi:hypothetical protein
VLLPRCDGDSMTQEQFTTPLVTPALFMIFHAPASQPIARLILFGKRGGTPMPLSRWVRTHLLAIRFLLQRCVGRASRPAMRTAGLPDKPDPRSRLWPSRMRETPQ